VNDPGRRPLELEEEKDTVMRITQIDLYQVVVPYIPAIRKYRPDEAATRGPIPVIRVSTDEGITGWGEGFRGQNIEAQIPRFIGADPLAINLAELDAPFHAALYDLVGKALNVPAYRLMGGKCRDAVPVSYWSCYMTPEDTAKEAAVGASLGFTTHKLKARPHDIVEQCELITRAAGPDYGIIIDPNFTFVSFPESVKLARKLERYNVLCFEDPFPWANNLAQYRLFRQRSDIPLAPHASRVRLDQPGDVLNAIREDAADLFNVSGTVAAMQKASAIAETAGLPVWHQAYGLCLGIGGAFSVHVAANVPNATVPGDILPFLREHQLLVGDPLRPVSSQMPVPEGPGLGVEIDEAALARYRVA
jgi:L-alanine-DL-glutamate epimerase-like enolase superfamily enzyme